MTAAAALLLVAAALPLLIGLLLAGARRPLEHLLPLYAASVPFGSGLALPGLPASYFSASSLLGAALTVALGLRLVSGAPTVRRVPLAAVTWLLFLALCGASVHWSIVPAETLSDFVPLLATVALYVLLRLTPADSRSLRRFELGTLAGGIAVAAYGLVQAASGTLAGSTGQRLGDELNDPNHLAASLLLPVALALRAGAAAPRVAARLAAALGAAAMLLAIVLTASRGGLLGIVVVLVVLSTVGAQRARLAVVGVLVTIVATVAVALLPGSVHTRLLSSDPSGRTDVWRVALNACGEHCGAGAGWGTFGEVYAQTLPDTPQARVNPRRANFEPHNNLLLVAVETGVLGLALVVSGLVLAVREAWSTPSPRRGPPVAAVLGVLTTGMLIGNLEFKYFWLVLVYAGMAAQVSGSGADEVTAGAGSTVRARSSAG